MAKYARLRDMPGLGPKSEEQLIAIGITTPDQLRDIGPIPAYIKLREQLGSVSLNFLYALVGAVEGEHWLRVAREEKAGLIMELDGYDQLEKIWETLR